MEDAIEKAEEFLEGHHSTINLKSSEIENGMLLQVLALGKILMVKCLE